MIQETTSTKLINTGLAASSGGAMSAPVFSVGSGEALLYVLGLIISLIAFSHNEYHKNRSETKMQMITKASRYIAVGVFTYPSAYAYAGNSVWNYSAFQGLVGVIATLIIVALMDAWIIGKEKELKGDK